MICRCSLLLLNVDSLIQSLMRRVDRWNRRHVTRGHLLSGRGCQAWAGLLAVNYSSVIGAQNRFEFNSTINALVRPFGIHPLFPCTVRCVALNRLKQAAASGAGHGPLNNLEGCGQALQDQTTNVEYGTTDTGSVCLRHHNHLDSTQLFHSYSALLAVFMFTLFSFSEF